MFTGLNRLLAPAFVVGVLLVAPSAALACGGGPSAQNVYKECLPTGGGGKSTSGPAGESTNGPAGAGGKASSSISNQTALALKHTGKDRRILASLVHGYGVHRFDGTTPSSGDYSSPTALGSVLDLAGPTILLIVLAGTALLLLGGSGMRIWRRQHRA